MPSSSQQLQPESLGLGPACLLSAATLMVSCCCRGGGGAEAPPAAPIRLEISLTRHVTASSTFTFSLARRDHTQHTTHVDDRH